jgi:hypothetical protein
VRAIHFTIPGVGRPLNIKFDVACSWNSRCNKNKGQAIPARDLDTALARMNDWQARHEN